MQRGEAGARDQVSDVGTQVRVDDAGAMNADLREACIAALKIPREVARAHAEKFSWRAASEQFLNHLKPVPSTEVHLTALA